MSILVSSGVRTSKPLSLSHGSPGGEQYSLWPALPFTERNTGSSLSYYDGPSVPRLRYPSPEGLNLPARSLTRIGSVRAFGGVSGSARSIRPRVEVFDGPAKPKRPPQRIPNNYFLSKRTVRSPYSSATLVVSGALLLTVFGVVENTLMSSIIADSFA